MSRFKRFTHSVVSGYVLLGTNVAYTFASVPLALNYLSKKEIGLWGVVTQIAGYLVLVDLGMAGSISRILIDHKDRIADGVYGSVIKTGALVLLVQGAIIAVAGVLVSVWLPDLFSVPLEHRRKFQILVAGHCLVLGSLFVGRMFNHLLLAHQRYDAMNYGQIGGLVVNIGLMWLGFELGWGMYSLLAGYAASTVLTTIVSLVAVLGLKLLPGVGEWGKANMKTFKELFAFGRELFFISVGWQMVNASQMLVIGRTLGFDAAGIWSIATKPFTMAQQIVYRLLDYASAGFAEMMVRRERERLLGRLRDLVIVSASLSAWVGLAVAICNHDFLGVWTKHKVSWSTTSDWLMGLLVVVYSTTRCLFGFIGITKEIKGMKYVYPVEGLAFIVLSFLTVPKWGINSLILNALLTNILCTGVYSFWRAKRYFGLPSVAPLLGWLRWPVMCLLALGLTFFAWGMATSTWPERTRLVASGLCAGLVGAAMFWRVGLAPNLRSEVTAVFRSWLLRLRRVGGKAS